MTEFVLALPVAIVLDVIFGDPDVELHPVQLIRRTANGGHRLLRKIQAATILGGVVLLVLLLGFFVGLYAGTAYLLQFATVPVVIVVNGFLVYACLSFRHRLQTGLLMLDALRDDEDGQDKFKEALHRVDSRDVSVMDRPARSRAAVEQLADGFLFYLFGPVFWYTIAGGAGLLLPISPVATATGSVFVFRIAHEVESQLGHPGRRYSGSRLGAAFLVDLLGFVPARLGFPFLLVASVMSGAEAQNAVRVWFRDHRKHNDLNLGHVVSVLAGALNVRLGGPVVYPDGVVEQSWIGDGTSSVSVTKLKMGIQILFWAGILTYFVAGLGVHFWSGLQVIV